MATEGQIATHCTLVDFDSGSDTIEVIYLSDFYGRVIKDLGFGKSVKEAPAEMKKMNYWLASIGALTEIVSSQNEGEQRTRAIRFDVLRSAWLLHGYQFSNQKKLRKMHGMNFNMLSVKSIRIMNRFSSKISKFHALYRKRIENSQSNHLNLQDNNRSRGSMKPKDDLLAVILILFAELVE